MTATGSPATSGDDGEGLTTVRGDAGDDRAAPAPAPARLPSAAPEPVLSPEHAPAAARRVLAIDPGAASTRLAVVVGGVSLASGALTHPPGPPRAVEEEFAERLAAVTDWLADHDVDPATCDAVVGRGGLVRPVAAGTYRVTDAMVADLRAGVRGRHAANLGGLLARAIADRAGVPAFVVDPVGVDEFAPVARVAGIADLERVSLVHALNVRAVARLDCAEQGVRFEDVNLVVAHLGTGFSIVALDHGRMVDANNAHEEGPFTPQRCGGLPAGQLAELIHSGRLPDWPATRDFLHVHGGVLAYLGTADLDEVERRIDAGDRLAADVLDAMAYQIGKAIGSYAAVLAGRVDAILLTGGVAHSLRVVSGVLPMVGWIAPVRIYPGEHELAALAEGAARAVDGAEPARDYPSDEEGRR